MGGQKGRRASPRGGRRAERAYDVHVTILRANLLWCVVCACNPSPSIAQLDDHEAAVSASALSALLESPAFAQNAAAARGFCLGLQQGQASQPLDPSPSLLPVGSRTVPLFAYSECEPRPTPGWGDVRHAPSGKQVGVIVMGAVTDGSGSSRVSFKIDGGPFAAAGFVCAVPSSGPATCELSWIS